MGGGGGGQEHPRVLPFFTPSPGVMERTPHADGGASQEEGVVGRGRGVRLAQNRGVWETVGAGVSGPWQGGGSLQDAGPSLQRPCAGR